MEILYKYRSLSNLRYFLDIILNNRLYAAIYDELNDPMEGAYVTYRNNPHLIHDLKVEKQRWRIVSSSTEKNNMLMWAHYSDAHKGCCIGFTLKPNSTLDQRKITYSANLQEISNRTLGKDLLSFKSLDWKYEDEVRIFTKKLILILLLKR